MGTENGGESWDVIIEDPSTSPADILIPLGNPDFIYSDSIPDSLTDLNPSWIDSGGFAVSYDGGVSWEYRETGWRGSWEVGTSYDGSTIYARATLGDIDGLIISGIIKSTDWGNAWQLLDLDIHGVNNVDQIQVDPTDASTVYAVLALRNDISTNILVRSTDGGTTWDVIAENVYKFYLNTTNPSYVYYNAGFKDGKIYVSADRGDTWSPTYSSLDTLNVYDLKVHPANAELLFAATQEQGVLFSLNQGESWSPFPSLAGEAEIRHLSVIQTDSTYVFGSTQESGLKVLSLTAGFQSTQGDDIQIVSRFNLYANYPNPFNPLTNLRYDLPHATHVTLTVYNLLGREVIRLVDDYMEPGYHEVQWDGREFASGIYIARLVTPEYSKSIKMVLLK
jgi:hypothetical protein